MLTSSDRPALARLLAPNSIAFVGGAEAEVALSGTLKLDFPGKIFHAEWLLYEMNTFFQYAVINDDV